MRAAHDYSNQNGKKKIVATGVWHVTIKDAGTRAARDDNKEKMIVVTEGVGGFKRTEGFWHKCIA